MHRNYGIAFVIPRKKAGLVRNGKVGGVMDVIGIFGRSLGDS